MDDGKCVGFDDVDIAEVERQEAQLKQAEAQLQREKRHDEKTGETIEDADIEAMEREVEKKNRASGFFGAVGNTFKDLGDSVSSLGKKKEKKDEAADDAEKRSSKPLPEKPLPGIQKPLPSEPKTDGSSS